MSGQIQTRKTYSAARLADLRSKLTEAGKIAKDCACVYATGSYGRVEASKHSDLDVVIVGQSEKLAEGFEAKLTRLDEICLKAELISTARAANFQEFSGDGEFLTHYPKHWFVENLGKQHDDSTNTFTARLLLLLESECLVGQELYDEAIRDVLNAYWRDFSGHEKEFVPGFLVNDILRLWRTFCVNYEARTESQSDEKKAKRQVKHYKLQHSRLLTCYSGVLQLLNVFSNHQTVTLEDACEMTKLTPIERIEKIAERSDQAGKLSQGVIEAYAKFLELTAAPKEELIKRILEKGHEQALPSTDLNRTVFELVQELGQANGLHQQVVV